MKLSEISVNEMRSAIEDKLCAYFAVTSETASNEQVFQACAMVIRELMSRLKVSESQNTDGKMVHYMSMEFLIGRSLMKNAYNLGCGEALTAALEEMGFQSVEMFSTTDPADPSIIPDVEAAREVRRIFEDRGLHFACYSVYADLYGKPERLQTMLLHADIAAALGSPYLHYTILPWLTLGPEHPSIDEGISFAVDIAGIFSLDKKRIFSTDAYFAVNAKIFSQSYGVFACILIWYVAYNRCYGFYIQFRVCFCQHNGYCVIHTGVGINYYRSS